MYSGVTLRNPTPSPPEEKFSPLPRTTTTRTASFASISRNTAPNCSRVGTVMMLSGGASNVSTATGLSLRYSTRNMESGYSVIAVCPSWFHLMLNRHIIEFILSRLQFAPQNLPHRRFWDFFDEHVASRTFEPRQL